MVWVTDGVLPADQRGGPAVRQRPGDDAARPTQHRPQDRRDRQAEAGEQHPAGVEQQREQHNQDADEGDALPTWPHSPLPAEVLKRATADRRRAGGRPGRVGVAAVGVAGGEPVGVGGHGLFSWMVSRHVGRLWP
jgi:hypothetical protein